MTLSNINALLPYHSNISADTTVSVINYMLDETARGKTIFYDIYTAEEKKADPTKLNYRPVFLSRKARRAFCDSLWPK
jgi:hypothetical protein